METALCFQHVERVTNALKTSTGGGWNGHAQAILYWLAKSSDIAHVRQACASYKKVGTQSWFLARFPYVNYHVGCCCTDIVNRGKVATEKCANRKTSFIPHRSLSCEK